MLVKRIEGSTYEQPFDSATGSGPPACPSGFSTGGQFIPTRQSVSFFRRHFRIELNQPAVEIALETSPPASMPAAAPVNLSPHSAQSERVDVRVGLPTITWPH